MLKRYLTSGLAWTWLAVIVVLIDRFSKEWVVAHLAPLESLVILPVFNFTLAYNTGAAFSFLHSASGWQTFVLGSLAIIVSVYVIYWLATISSKEYWLNIALNFILGGAIGNVWDRFMYGYVIDFIDVHLGDWHFAIFNIADSAITVGAAMLLLYWFWKSRELEEKL